VLLRRTRALKRHLPAAFKGDYQGVHQARVASRRLREAVPVLAAGLKASKAGKARRKIRRLTRALGAVRELDVTLRLLDELARSKDVPRAAVEDVRAHVIAERDRRRGVMFKRLERVDVDKLSRRLASVAEALDHARDDGWRDALAARLVKRARRLSEAADRAGQMYVPERLHQVRIAAKKLRYGLEIAADIGIPSAGPRVRTIKRVQDMLGVLHDLQVLVLHVAAVQADGGTTRAAGPGLEILARHIEDRCRHLHGRYVGSAPALRDLCAEVLNTVLPQLARGRRRPLKMTLARGAARAAQGGR
jgi:CHAD domain-containing protein